MIARLQSRVKNDMGETIHVWTALVIFLLHIYYDGFFHFVNLFLKKYKYLFLYKKAEETQLSSIK
ncbi:hypothetical protein DW886_16330 [Enterocloster aldenensis]|nr:hypothetical protein DW886_16330 [Enterocloster aldenensis]